MERPVRHFVFDVDGTLTPSRGMIDPNFKTFFDMFCKTNKVYLVTGSDKPKTVEQLTERTFNLAKRSYNCSGNDVWEGDNHIRTSNWKLPADAQQWLEGELEDSGFPLRTGNHIEHRPGMVNFSVVGRNCTLAERRLYVKWDKECSERTIIANSFNARYPQLEARVGGETGLDISPRGLDKSQIVTDFGNNDRIHFFGDAMQPGGNDYPLAAKLNHNRCYHVKDWQDTLERLSYFIEAGIAN